MSFEVYESTSTPLELVEGKQAVIMRNITFAEIKKRLEELFSTSATGVMLLEAGRTCGKRSADRLATELKIKGRNILPELVELKKAEGWGIIDFKDLNLDAKVGRIIVKDSFEALGYKRSTTPVCHFLRGYLIGALSYVLGGDVMLTETRCLAKGDPYCEFQL